MRYLYLALALLTFSTASLTAQTAQKLTATKANDYGLIYSLPLTVVDVTLEVEITREIPGEFCNYARKYLNVSDPIMHKNSSARLLKVYLNTRGIPDEENKWVVQFKSGSSPFIIIGENGCPLAINTESVEVTNTVELPKSTNWSSSPLEGPAASQAMTQEMIQCTSTPKRAELVAARIYELREARNDIITGQSDQTFPDGSSLQLALDNIAAQEAALTAMFVGVKQTMKQVVTLPYEPQEEGKMVLCRISDIEGIVPANDLSGAPVYIDMALINEGKIPTTEKGEVKKFPKGGLAYNIPGTVQIEITYNGKTVAKESINVAQFGDTFGLDPTMFSDKKMMSSAVFDPATGAVLKIVPVE